MFILSKEKGLEIFDYKNISTGHNVVYMDVYVS